MNTKFSWFPGHMKKAMDALSDEVKGASAVIVVLDSRCPDSSFNPLLEKLFRNKPIVYVLNKVEMSSVKISQDWLAYFDSIGRPAVLVSCKTGEGKKKLVKILEKISTEYFKTHRKKYISPTFKLMVIGVPNTGKSSVINLLSPQKTVKTGKKPGLTRGKQWLKIKPGMEVLDSPGISPPRMDGPNTGWVLGTIAAIKQEILPVEEVAGELIKFFIKKEIFPEALFVEGKPSLSYVVPASSAASSLSAVDEVETKSDEMKTVAESGENSVSENPISDGIHENGDQKKEDHEKRMQAESHQNDVNTEDCTNKESSENNGESSEVSQESINAIISSFAKARGFLAKGGETDREKASLQILKLFREGKFGRISLESPPTW